MNGRPPRKKLNAAQRRELRIEAIRLYEHKAGRRAQKGVEPNDRGHDREVEESVRRTNPLILAALLTEDEGGNPEGTSTDA